MGTWRRLAYLVASAGVLAIAVASSTAAGTFQMTTAFTAPVTNPCNGDPVVVVGQSHTVLVTGENRVEIQENWPDTSGLAADGTLYQANDANHVFVMTVPNGRFTIRLIDSFELVSKDPSANFLVHEIVEVIFDPETGFNVNIRGAGADCSGQTTAP